MKVFSILIMSLIVLTSCNKSLSEEEQFDKDISLIKEYIADNNLDAMSTDSGLYYTIDKLGTGNFPNANNKVTVRYKGYFLDGGVFDQSDEFGIPVNLQNVIQGWTEGIQLYKEGGEGLLLVPSKLGYGKQGKGSVPPNTVMIFEVKLLEIVD